MGETLAASHERFDSQFKPKKSHAYWPIFYPTITVNLTQVADTLCFLNRTAIAGLGFVGWTTCSKEQTFKAQFFARLISSQETVKW
jgi:hypothetical protein